MLLACLAAGTYSLKRPFMLNFLQKEFPILLDIANAINGMFYRCKSDKQRTMLFVTQGCEALTGYKPEELLNNSQVSFGQLIHPDDAGAWLPGHFSSLRDKKPHESSYRIIDRFGHIKTVWEKAAGVYDSLGNLMYIEGYIADTTEMEEKRTISNELLLYRKAIDVNTISSITDKNGTIIYANRKFCEVSKYNENELLGSNHRIVNSGLHSPEFFRGMWKTINSGNVWQGEIRNKAKDGSYYWVDTSIIPIRDNEGEVYRFLSLRTLVTNRKLAEEKILHYARGLEELLSVTSHRVRKPVSNCLGMIHLLEKSETLSSAEFKRIASYFKASAEELDSFTRELTIMMQNIKEKEMGGD